MCSNGRPFDTLTLAQITGQEGGRRQKWWVAVYYYNVCDLIWFALQACSWSHGEEAAVDSRALESSARIAGKYRREGFGDADHRGFPLHESKGTVEGPRLASTVL